MKNWERFNKVLHGNFSICRALYWMKVEYRRQSEFICIDDSTQRVRSKDLLNILNIPYFFYFESSVTLFFIKFNLFYCKVETKYILICHFNFDGKSFKRLQMASSLAKVSISLATSVLHNIYANGKVIFVVVTFLLTWKH